MIGDAIVIPTPSPERMQHVVSNLVQVVAAADNVLDALAAAEPVEHDYPNTSTYHHALYSHRRQVEQVKAIRTVTTIMMNGVIKRGTTSLEMPHV